MDIHKMIGKLAPILPKKGLVLYKHKYTGPYNPLEKQLDENDQPLPGQEPYNAVDAISMRHDICYRDHGNKEGKQKCDGEMLKELTVLKPKDLREKIDRKLVQRIIGMKHRMGWGLDKKDDDYSTIQWSNELADELHKPIRRKFQKRKVFAKTVDDIWTADLVEMAPLAKFNKGYKYLLMIIDVFSKYGWIVPLKTKTGAAVAHAFKEVFHKSGRIPTRLWTDKGKEFYNKTMKELLKRNNNIILYSTENEEKSSVAERWNRTMKRNMWKYFTANNTHKYIDILPALVEKYNNTYHHSIKCKPKDAIDPKNYTHVFKALYGDTADLAKKPSFKVGDRVRIVKKKKTFEKGFTSNWTEEIFTITQVKNTKPPTYTIEDTKGEEIHGTFYEPELQKTSQTIYRVEKVLKRRKTKDGQKQVYVKWKGYNNTFNSWIPVDDIQEQKHGNQQ